MSNHANHLMMCDVHIYGFMWVAMCYLICPPPGSTPAYHQSVATCMLTINCFIMPKPYNSLFNFLADPLCVPTDLSFLRKLPYSLICQMHVCIFN